MLKTFLTVCCLVFFTGLWAQVDSTKGKDDRYIYLYRTAGGVQVSHYHCFIEDGKQVLVVKKGNIIATLVLQQPNIFELVEKSRAEIIAVKNELQAGDNRGDLFDDFRDPNIIVSQMGIQSSFIQYNHFTIKSKKYISYLDATTKKGFEIINQLIAVLDKAAKAVSEE